MAKRSKKKQNVITQYAKGAADLVVGAIRQALAFSDAHPIISFLFKRVLIIAIVSGLFVCLWNQAMVPVLELHTKMSLLDGVFVLALVNLIRRFFGIIEEDNKNVNR